MLRLLRTSLLLMVGLLCAPPIAAVAQASQPSSAEHFVMAVNLAGPSVSAASTVPAPTPDTNLFTLNSLIAFTAVGATRQLRKAIFWNQEKYGPGLKENDFEVEVPDDFPEVDENGDVVFEEGSKAAKNRAKVRSSNASFASPPSTGGVNTGEDQLGTGSSTVSGKTQAELEAMTKDDLVELANDVGVVVERADGEAGEPLKSDYVQALSKTRSVAG